MGGSPSPTATRTFSWAGVVRRVFSRLWLRFARLLHQHTILVLTLMFTGGVAIALGRAWRIQSNLIESTAIETAELYSEALAEFRTVYTSEVVERVRPYGIEVTHDYAKKDRAIPLPATLSMELGRRIGTHRLGAQSQLYSAYPFPWRRETGGLRDDFARQAWSRVREHPDKPFYRFENYEGRLSLRYATADRMRPACVACHNSHPDSPKRDWEVGDVRGILEVIYPVDAIVGETWTFRGGTLALVTAMTALGLLGLTIVIQKLRRTSADLEQRVEERTAELQTVNGDLGLEIMARKHAQDLVEKTAEELSRANIELERFAYVASHDLKAPLRAIENLSTWVEEDLGDKLEGPSREHMDLLRGRVGRMEALLDGLLAYSRAGRLRAKPEPVDVAELLRNISDLLGPPEGFAIDVRGDLPRFETARAPLQQVLLNLITNAIKHHDRPNGRVEVAVGDKDPFYEFRVADDGPGIPPEFFGKVFEMFQTLKSRDEVEGSGMGLAIVKKVVEGCGGRVAVESAGRGTTFRFTWPRFWPRS